jgi:hypothetical protein
MRILIVDCIQRGKNDGQLYLKLSKTRVEKSNVSLFNEFSLSHFPRNR